MIAILDQEECNIISVRLINLVCHVNDLASNQVDRVKWPVSLVWWQHSSTYYYGSVNEGCNPV